MHGSGDGSVLARMAERRLVCEREIPIQQHRIDSLLTISTARFDSARTAAQRTIQLQDKLGNVKGELSEAEDALVKALSVKTRKEAKWMAMMDSISGMRARVEELKRVVEDQMERKDEYAAIVSQQFEDLTGCKEKFTRNREHREQIEEAISWYKSALGFRIECGHGVKFIFTNINRENPVEEYSFVIRHENDIYNLLNCDPHLSGTKELVNELNKTNGLFKFVRKMRDIFHEAATHGVPLHRSSIDQEYSIISISAPEASVSTDHSYDTPTGPHKEKGIQCNSTSRNVSDGHIINSPHSSTLVVRHV